MKHKSLIVRQGFYEEEMGFLECQGREIRTPDSLLIDLFKKDFYAMG